MKYRKKPVWMKNRNAERRGMKTKVEFYRNTEKRFMSDKITITEYDVFANRQNKGVYLLFIANGAGTDS